MDYNKLKKEVLKKYRDIESQKSKLDKEFNDYLQRIIYENNFYHKEYIDDEDNDTTFAQVEIDVIDKDYDEFTEEDTVRIEYATNEELFDNIMYYLDE